MDEIKIMSVSQVPLNLDKAVFVTALSQEKFLVWHDTARARTIIATCQKAVEKIDSVLPGLEFTDFEEKLEFAMPVGIVSFLYKEPVSFEDRETFEVFGDLYKILRESQDKICICFNPIGADEVNLLKTKIEHLLSTKETRQTKSQGDRSLSYSFTNAVQMENYYDSDEKKVLVSILEALDDIVISNGFCYKVLIVCEDREKVLNYLKSKLLIIEKIGIRNGSLESIYSKSEKIDAFPYNIKKVLQMLSFSENIQKGPNVKTGISNFASGNITLGTFMEESVRNTNIPVKIMNSALNLGCLITGLPGSGKTVEAMSICKQVKFCSEKDTRIVVISPTNEWLGIATESNLEYVQPYGPERAINFFKCSSGINIERFYENLAVLIASSSNAGPYRNSLEKCLLAAFRRVYSITRNPDPLEVYESIERAIIEHHGKESNIGVKYTKHGENIRAALEGLRLLLFREEFSSIKGEDFGKLIEKGVVFDLSCVSNSMKPLFYGLILNQVYSFSEEFDTFGDNKLRMLILIEEAQLIFSQDEISGATLDLKQRIQDFRKKGVGLMLVTHNITDINPGIRRLCQNKLYFRQSNDIAKYAFSDLGFAESQMEQALNRLKSTERRTCAVSIVERTSKGSRVIEPTFITTNDFHFEARENAAAATTIKRSDSAKGMKIQIVDLEEKPVENLRVSVSYVWERIGDFITDKNGTVNIEGVIRHRRYKVQVFDIGRRKALFANDIISEPLLVIKIER